MDKTVGSSLRARGLWESASGRIAIDWVTGRFVVEMEFLGGGLNVQSGLHKLETASVARRDRAD